MNKSNVLATSRETQRRLIIWPTLISFVITVLLAIASVAPIPKDSIKWFDIFRDSVFFWLLSTTLGIIIQSSLQYLGSDSYALIRAIHADGETTKTIETIGSIQNECSQTHKFYIRRLDEVLRRLQEDLHPLSAGYYKCSESSIIDITEEIYNDTDRDIRAISFINTSFYWNNKKYALQLQNMTVAAVARKIKIVRVFIFQDYQDLQNSVGILQKQADVGVEVYYVLKAELHKDLWVDFSVYDNLYVQSFELGPSGSNQEYQQCTVSRLKTEINKYNEIHAKIIRLSTPYQSGKPLPARKSMWDIDQMTEHYDGPPPELRLDLLQNLVPVAGKLRVLDIGCGLGRTILPFVNDQREWDIVGIDEDDRAVEACRVKFKGQVQMIHKRFSKNVISNQGFNVIVAYNSIYHCHRDEMLDAIKYAERLLLPGGYFLLTIKTVRGNEPTLKGAIYGDEENTWLNCNMPDPENLHHFSTDEEIEEVKSLFSSVVYEEPVSLIALRGRIVQAAGYYFIFQKGQ